MTKYNLYLIPIPNFFPLMKDTERWGRQGNGGRGQGTERERVKEKNLKHLIALAGWLSWLEHHTIKQKVVGSILSQGTCLGCRLDPQSGHIQEATD